MGQRFLIVQNMCFLLVIFIVDRMDVLTGVKLLLLIKQILYIIVQNCLFILMNILGLVISMKYHVNVSQC